MSSLTTTLWILFLLFICLIISWSNRTFSKILLSLTMHVWFLEMIRGSTVTIFSWSIFEMILEAKVLKLMSLRSMMLLTFFFLEIRTRFLWEMYLGNFYPQMKVFTILITSFLLMFQQFWKNCPETQTPSGPMMLFLFREKNHFSYLFNTR